MRSLFIVLMLFSSSAFADGTTIVVQDDKAVPITSKRVILEYVVQGSSDLQKKEIQPRANGEITLEGVAEVKNCKLPTNQPCQTRVVYK